MTPDDLKFGCPKAPEDPRDYRYSAATDLEATNIDLRSFCPPVRNQGGLGACTAFGATSLVDFIRRRQSLTTWLPSPLFTYYSTRLMEGTVDTDSGAYVRDALKSTVNDGVALEREWPYLIDKFNIRPDTSVWDSATKHQTLEYLKIDDSSKKDIIACLAEGYPFIFGLRLYSSFTNRLETMFGGHVFEPNRDTEKILGGHCMMCVGYRIDKDGSEYVIVMNSWGEGWGDRGFCYIPINYFLSNDSYDFWTIRLMEVCDEDTPDPVPVVVPPIPEPTPDPTPEPIPEPIAPVVVIPPVVVPPAPEPEPPAPIVPPAPEVDPLNIEEEQKKMDRKVLVAVSLFVIVLILFLTIK